MNIESPLAELFSRIHSPEFLSSDSDCSPRRFLSDDFASELPDVIDLDDDDDMSDTFLSSGFIEHKASGISINERGLLLPLENQMDPDDIEVDRSGELLGRGSGGFVLRGFHRPTKTPLALKIVKFEDKQKRAQFINDLYASLHVSSEFLVTLFGTYIHRETGCFHAALELMDRGSLLDLRDTIPSGIPEGYLSFITRRIMGGLRCLHDHDFVHRDIKLSNILMNAQGEIKIADFGISKRLENTTHCNTYVGTSIYLSPERVKGLDYGREADIWSLGVCIYELATGKHPFEEISSFCDLFDAIVNRKEAPQLPAGMEALQSFTDSCMMEDTVERHTLDELMTESFLYSHARTMTQQKFSSWLESVKHASNALEQ